MVYSPGSDFFSLFVAGDLFDEGKWCDDSEFNYHASRFRSMFAVPDGTQLHVLSGNHDEGFHYMYVVCSSPVMKSSLYTPLLRIRKHVKLVYGYKVDC